MKDPSVTGDPAHTRDMLYRARGEPVSEDNDDGYVHTNSNIHNKAAYHLFTAEESASRRKKRQLAFSPREVARLYYFTLQRLDRVATFEDVLDTMIEVATVVYPDPAAREPKLAAIRDAYRRVGIPRDREVKPATARERRRKGKSRR